MKIMKFFEDLVEGERLIEARRRRPEMKEINIRDVFYFMDSEGRGSLDSEDYIKLFEEFYNSKLPVSLEDINYLFMKHDKEKTGQIT